MLPSGRMGDRASLCGRTDAAFHRLGETYLKTIDDLKASTVNRTMRLGTVPISPTQPFDDQVV